MRLPDPARVFGFNLRVISVLSTVKLGCHEKASDLHLVVITWMVCMFRYIFTRVEEYLYIFITIVAAILWRMTCMC